METRASYTLVGAFTLLILAGTLLFVLWTAKKEQGQMRTYRIEFNQSVSGLSLGSSVLLEGVRIGQVTSIKVSPEDPGTVNVLVLVAADAPVRKNSEATLEPQGVTGVAAVAVSGGTADAPMLAESTQAMPQIPSKVSKLQEIMNSVPSILSQVDTVVTRANALLSPENTADIGRMLTSIADISEGLAKNKDSLSKGLQGFGETGQRLKRLITSSQTLVDKDLRDTVRSIDKAATRFNTLMTTMEPGMTRFSRESVDELHLLLVEARRLLGNLAKLSQKLESDPRRFLLGNQVPEFSVP